MQVEIKGSQLRMQMQQISSTLHRQLTAAIRQSVLFAERTMKQKAPVRTGILRASITHELGELEGRVFPRAPYAPYVEYPTKPHVILPRLRFALRWKEGGHAVFARKVQHPGTRAQPFVGPTLTETHRFLTEQLERMQLE